MAGNTKFMGFGSNTEVTLERWGEKVSVALPGPAVEVLREACFRRLPKAPKKRRPRSQVSYEESTGTIQMALSPKEAEALEGYVRELGNHFDCTEEDQNVIDGWLVGLGFALEDHKRYVDTQGEPGVESGA